MLKEMVLENEIVETRRKLPSSVDFMLLGACNLRCSFCFGPQHEIPAMETGLVIEVIHKLARNDVERIIFTGGEPTLIEELPNILTAAKNSNLKTVLSTNGLLLSLREELLKRIAPHLDWIALPLDGDTPEANALMRVGFRPEAGWRHFEAVLNLIPRIRKEHSNLKIKLGTVVAQANLTHIIGIPKVLSSHQAIPDTWKLYQVSPSEYGKRNYPRLKVSDDDFERIYREVEIEARQVGIPSIVKYTNKERPGKYLFINPKGEVLIVDQNDNDYHSIGNVLEDFDAVIESWGNYVNHGLLTRNFDATYP